MAKRTSSNGDQFQLQTVQLYGSLHDVPEANHESPEIAELISSIDAIKLFQREIVGSSDSELSKVRSSALNSYNKSCAIRSLSSSFSELEELKWRLKDRLEIERAKATTSVVNPYHEISKDPKARRLAEMTAVSLVKNFILKEKEVGTW
ncbi:MAG: hypothetical protein K2X29_00970 [Candidatus Obscuribacterales bacterium]|nr:hypothetical protein [Candidatus Obscuribacterales bacterium]